MAFGVVTQILVVGRGAAPDRTPLSCAGRPQDDHTAVRRFALRLLSRLSEHWRPLCLPKLVGAVARCLARR